MRNQKRNINNSKKKKHKKQKEKTIVKKVMICENIKELLIVKEESEF